MAPRDRDRRKTEAAALEALEIEPVDLEPVELEDAPDVHRRASRPRRRRGRAGRLVALIVVVAAVVVAATVVVSGRRHNRPSSTPPPATAPAADELGGPPTDPVAALAQHLDRYWPDGQAIVMYGRLYVARREDSSPTLVVPELHAVIEDQSGSSLLISTFPELLVATQPRIATRVLSPRSVAIRASEPDEWWLLNDGDTLRDTLTGNVLRPPAGLRVAAAVPHGFVALDAPRAQWVLWSGDPTTRIIAAKAQLVAVRGSTAVFRSGCSIDACALEIVDLARGRAIDGYVPGVPEFAAFSPTGSRLALATTLGDVFLMDPADGAMIARTRSRALPSLSSPLAWSSDGRRLLVVQQDSIEVRGADDGAVTEVITGTAGLEQVAGLP